jgi:hypothetical protein
VTGCCEYGNEASGSIKFWEVVESLSDCSGEGGLGSVELVNISVVRIFISV